MITQWLDKLRKYSDEYKDLTPEQLLTQCVHEKLDNALKSYLERLDEQWKSLYRNSTEGILESYSKWDKDLAFSSIKTYDRYKLSDVLYYKGLLDKAKEKARKQQQKAEENI